MNRASLQTPVKAQVLESYQNFLNHQIIQKLLIISIKILLESSFISTSPSKLFQASAIQELKLNLKIEISIMTSNYSLNKTL